MMEPRQGDGLVEQRHADQLAALGQGQIIDPIVAVERQVARRVGGVRTLHLLGVEGGRDGEKKLAPKAWEERSRLPRFMGLLMLSTPMAK